MEIVKSPPEQRVLLRNVSWETYEQLLKEREEYPSPRFFYDRGVLEMVSPSTEHEEIADLIAFVVRELAAEWEIDERVAGHTAFRRGDLSGGFEADGSFYLSENAARVRGKTNIDLDAGDTPPDHVVEVDRTSHSLDKLPIYARLGVPEVWRYVVERTGRPEILGLGGDTYEPMAESRVLPPLTADALTRFVEEGLTTRYPTWVRRVREWAQGKASDQESLP